MGDEMAEESLPAGASGEVSGDIAGKDRLDDTRDSPPGFSMSPCSPIVLLDVGSRFFVLRVRPKARAALMANVYAFRDRACSCASKASAADAARILAKVTFGADVIAAMRCQYRMLF